MPGPTVLALQAVGSWPGALVLCYALVIGHALADFPLQGPFLAAAKDRHARPSATEGRGFPPTLWVFALTFHTMIHAAAVWLVTGSVVLALAENVLHWAIDFAKCERWLTFSQDQWLHLLCKAGIALVIFLGFLPP